MPFDAPIADKVQQSFQKLSSSAKALNKTSDELAASVAELDAALQKLNLGISRWIEIQEEIKNNQFATRYVGYDRVNGKWGIAIRSSIRKTKPSEPIESSSWLYNDSPRWLRTLAIDRIPDLLDGLIAEADKHRALIEAKLSRAKELATAVKGSTK